MRDVARLAGVSTSTVSAVVNGTAPVRPERKKRVIEAMAALDYHPDAIARGLRTGKTQAIGVIVPDITNAFYPEVIRGVEETAAEAGYSVLLCDSSESPEREREHLNTLFSRRVDGILVACCVDSTAWSLSSRDRFPVIYLDRLPPMAIEGTVCSDNLQAGHIAARHLIELGHERIAMMAGHLGLSTHRDRLEGFRKAMQEWHLPIRDEYLICGEVQIENGAEACRHLLSLAQPPTAIMVSNNKLLLGVLEGLEERHVRVPEEISLLGFDDYLWNRYFSPSLTAVAQDTFEIGRSACRLLLQEIESDRDPTQDQPQEKANGRRVCLPTTLRIRNSTAAPSARQR